MTHGHWRVGDVALFHSHWPVIILRIFLNRNGNINMLVAYYPECDHDKPLWILPEDIESDPELTLTHASAIRRCS